MSVLKELYLYLHNSLRIMEWNANGLLQLQQELQTVLDIENSYMIYYIYSLHQVLGYRTGCPPRHAAPRQPVHWGSSLTTTKDKK